MTDTDTDTAAQGEQTAQPAGDTTGDIIRTDIKQGIDMLAGIASVVAPGGALGGFAITELATLAKGLVDAEPGVVAAYENFQQAATGGAAPTPEAIAALKAAIDADDDALQTEVQQLDAAEAAQPHVVDP